MGGLKPPASTPAKPSPPAPPAGWPAKPGSSPPSSAASPRSSTWAEAKRFASEAQRIVKTIEAGGCEVEGCDWPPGMTHLHHLVRWVDGGHTNRDTMIMICPPHHTRAHDPRYDDEQAPHRQIRLPPTHVSRPIEQRSAIATTPPGDSSRHMRTHFRWASAYAPAWQPTTARPSRAVSRPPAQQSGPDHHLASVTTIDPRRTASIAQCEPAQPMRRRWCLGFGLLTQMRRR